MSTLAAQPGMAQGSPQEEEAIRMQVEQFEEAWNIGDAYLLAAHFDSAGDQILPGHPVVRGRAELEEWWSEHYSRMAEGRKISLTVNSLRFLKPDVAIVNVSAEFTGGHDPEGREIPPGRDRATYVMIKTGDQWLLAALRVMVAARDTADTAQAGPTAELLKKLNPYTGDEEKIAEGRKLYLRWNCYGCHASLGGGYTGRPLNDEEWLYGGDDASVLESIKQGTPGGMPAYAERMSEDETWKVIAYIRSYYKGDPSKVSW